MSIASSDHTTSRLNRFVERLEIRREALEQRSRKLSWVRFGIALTGGIAALVLYNAVGAQAAWVAILVVIAVFSLVVRFHNRLIDSIRRHRLYETIKSTHIARIERNWDAMPHTSPDEGDAEHPFARDLNLVGPRSLHHLIDTSFTREGSLRLRSWLTRTAPDVNQSLSQQALVKELVPLSRFRDRISLLSAVVTRTPGERWQGDVLTHWLDRHVDTGRIKTVLIMLSSLAVLTPVLLAFQIWGGLANWWTLSLLLYVGIYLLNFRLYTHLFDEAEHLYFQLNRFRPVLLFLERYRFKENSRLAELASPFQEAEGQPSTYLRKVLWLSIAASTQKNEVLRIVLNLLMPWELLFTLILSLYKKKLRVHLPAWIDAVQELEAACSLATFASLNPKCTFAELIDENELTPAATPHPVFVAQNIGHPLLANDVKISNNYEARFNGDIALITGSNMSGKSTFLRTLGTNLCLAYAGGPVDATLLRTIPFRLFTCINVADSVNDGISYFYAEVKRLKRLLLELEQGKATDHPSRYPLFFMIDEVFRGTNNRERYIGSRALLLSLCNGYGTGLVSTHDLELVKLENDVPSIRNFHFREHIEDGRMVFDYTLRPGPCPTTNALKIMQLEGLPVGEAIDLPG